MNGQPFEFGQTVAVLAPCADGESDEGATEQWQVCAVHAYIPELGAYDVVDVASTPNSVNRFIVPEEKVLLFPDPSSRQRLSQITSAADVVSRAAKERNDKTYVPNDADLEASKVLALWYFSDDSEYSSVFYKAYVISKPSDPQVNTILVRFETMANESIIPLDCCLLLEHPQSYYESILPSRRISK